MSHIGNIADPFTLAEALASSLIREGHTLYLRGGTYTGDFVCSQSGTLEHPIIIKPYLNERPIIDGTFTFSNHVHVYDIDFTDTRPNRLFGFYGTGADEGITLTGQGNHLHGCSVQQMHTDGVNWFGSEGANEGEVSECVILLNGDRFEDGSGHGHALYSHNNLGGKRSILRNSFYFGLGDYTIQLYSASNKTDDYDIENNTVMGPMFLGGHFGPNNLIFQNNLNYLYPVNIATGMGGHTCDGMNISGNKFFDCSAFAIGGGDGTLTNLTEANNLVYGGQPASREGYTVTEKPATLVTLTTFTKSTRWKGMLTIYNRDSAAEVAVDFSGLLTNGNYRLKNTQNLAETWDFTYSGASVNVPTNFTAGTFIGDDYEPATTFPVFGCFMIETR